MIWNNGRKLTYEIDPRHVEIIIEQLKLSEAKAVTTLGTKDEGTTQLDNKEMLDENDTSNYKASMTKNNYLNPDNPGISYAVKELAKNMSTSTKSNWAQLKNWDVT